MSPLFVAAGYSLITFFLCLIYAFLWNGYAARRNLNVTVGMSILIAFILITVIGVFNHFFGLYVHQPAFIAQETIPLFFTKRLLFTHAIGLFPFVFTTVHFESKLRNYHRQKSSSVVVNHPSVFDTHILIKGEVNDQSIEFTADSFRFAKASGNYVEYHFFKDGEPKKVLQRITLSKLEAELEKHAILTMKTHRSYIVHLSKIESVSGNAQGYALTLEDLKEKVPVSRYKVNEFNNRMNGKMDDSRH